MTTENQGLKKYINVAIPDSAKKLLTYSIITEAKSQNIIGKRVACNVLGNQKVGVVISVSDSTDLKKVLPIREVLDKKPVISEELIDLIDWMSKYYMTDLGAVIKLVIPKELLKLPKPIYSLSPENIDKVDTLNSIDKEIIDTILIHNKLSITDIKSVINNKKIDINLRNLVKHGYLEKEYPLPNVESGKKFVRCIIKNDKTENYKPLPTETKLKAYLTFLNSQNKPLLRKQITEEYGFSTYMVKKALDEGLCDEIEVETFRIPEILKSDVLTNGNFIPTNEQQKAIDSVDINSSEIYLLHGVTGSGKTLVYTEVVKKILSQNKKVICLVPEISLTAQTVIRFREAFGDKVAVLHSALSDGERFDAWRRIKDGKYDIVVGARSAVFAPISDLGLIIVDEEHDDSYKQIDPAPRYHAKHCAFMRAKLNNAPVICGSATPSIESYFHATEGRYKLLELKERAKKTELPKSTMIDLSKVPFGQIFSDYALDRINQELNQDNQVIIYHNRRGYSTYRVCGDCKEIEYCPHCSVSLTFHHKENELVCHHCGYVTKPQLHCSKCGGINVTFKGYGTQQLEDELSRLFPDKIIIRMDTDSTRKKNAVDKIRSEFSCRKGDILLGTKMVTKGHDFSGVTLVVVVNGDTELIFPDFRADEKALSTFVQVSGRSGRDGVRGETIIQSLRADNRVYDYAEKHDYLGFYNEEISFRRMLIYPPFAKIVKIIFTGNDENKLDKASSNFHKILTELNNDIATIYQPAKNLVYKVKDRYRMHIIVKSSTVQDKNGAKIRNLVRKAFEIFNKNFTQNISINVDIDPIMISG